MKRILGILMINIFIVMVGVGLITPILPELIIEFGASGRAIGLLVAAYGMTQFLLSPLTGQLSDRYGRKAFIVVGVIVFAVAKFIFAIGDELWMLYTSRLLEGMAAALIVPPMMAYVADITTTEERAKGNSLLAAAMSFGFVIGPGLGGLLAGYGTRVPLYAATGAAMVAVIFSVFCLPESLSKEQMKAARARMIQKESIYKQYARSLKSKYTMLFVLVLVMTFGLANFESVLGLYVTNRFQFSPQNIAVILTAGAVIGVGMQALVVAKIINKFGEQRVIKGSLLFTSVAYILFLLAKDFWSIFLVTSLIFFATAMLRPALNTQLSKMAGNEQGYVAGMNNAYMSVGNILGPTLAGFLFDANLFAPFIAGCCILLITFLLTLKLK
ncbi:MULTISPECIES: MFS transporter [Paenibacillus]|uniref:Multidrug transporter n=2 Tax=Paenibacillus TaxID=44249 RepID=A0ABX2Z4Y5_PAEPO|nr:MULTISPECIES: MFS transporter [Paenibacillus]AIW41125.1 multidrug transporter [Paenibacillus polymyxa CR1]APQ60678.1 multidrug transporter [Paenibacillus polymyxa]MCP3743971.1 MFS transporter [Paenibacillus sp. A3M_27_13]MDR6777218.1 DHA1 family multidrug resistance protein-like MFS transporter [Paenibacillus peoriae]ODA06282.1 multidrug transporter [Paenibacillus polymyxa]